jgi:beta-lactam-binding protein with PASTA domain
MKTTRWALLALWPAVAGCATAGFGRLDGVMSGDQLAVGGDLQDVRVIRDGSLTPTRPGMSLLKGDRIATGPDARAVISFAAGWEVIVETESELEILNPTIKMSFGRAIVTAYKKVKEILKAQTEYVVAAPESTQYLIDVRGDDFTLIVLRGRVRLESMTAAWPPAVYGPLDRARTVGPGRPQRGAPLSNSEAAQILRDVERIRRIVNPRMPQVVGLPREEAEQILRAAGLDAQVSLQIRGRGAVGTVVSQKPPADTEVRPGQRVQLLVEAPSVEVPDLRGASLAEARRVLEQHGMLLGRVFEELSPQADAGTVIAQTPRPGTRAAPGARVGVTVAIEGITVPDLRGQTLKGALDVLAQRGLVGTGAAQSTTAGKVRPGSVAAQSPVAGTLVRRGTQVTVYYYSPDRPTPADTPVLGRRPERIERATCRVPTLVGLSIDQAEEALKNTRLVLGDHPSDRRYTVTWQSHDAGSFTACGTRVSIKGEVIIR